MLDTEMPWLDAALDLSEAEKRILPALRSDELHRREYSVTSAKLSRHRPGRRCVIEYELCANRRSRDSCVRLTAKIRAKGIDDRTIDLIDALQAKGFDSRSRDCVSIPEIVAVVPEWHMWVCPRIPGYAVTDVIGHDADRVAGRVADVAHKLHVTPIHMNRTHLIEDELRILSDRLQEVAELHPDWHERLSRLRVRCESLAKRFEQPDELCPVHRDFYGDQIIVSGDRYFLIDLDQHALGDAALDFGNFVGHVTELALRETGDPSRFDGFRNALTNRAIEHGVSAERIGLYDLLTLARHVWISSRMSERRNLTPSILHLCESRVAEALGI